MTMLTRARGCFARTQEHRNRPRFATFSYPRSSVPHPFSPGLLKLEERIGEPTIERLRRLGHDAQVWPDWDFAAGGVCTILRERDGRLEGPGLDHRHIHVRGADQ